jgi:hypothetical protein
MGSRVNPYSLNHRWDEATHSAFKSMPLHGGYVVALDFLSPKDVPAFENQWRDWCRVTPKHLWPVWLDGWKERKAMRERRGR